MKAFLVTIDGLDSEGYDYMYSTFVLAKDRAESIDKVARDAGQSEDCGISIQYSYRVSKKQLQDILAVMDDDQPGDIWDGPKFRPHGDEPPHKFDTEPDRELSEDQ